MKQKVILAVIIENQSENEILLKKSRDTDGQTIWTLPNCYTKDKSSYECSDLMKLCLIEYNVSIKIDSAVVCFESSDYVVFHASLYSYTYPISEENNYQWIKTDNLETLCFDVMFLSVFKSLLKMYEQYTFIRKTIINVINDTSSKFKNYYNAVIQEQKDAIIVFIKYPENVSCPFGFRLDFTLNETYQIQFVTSIFIPRLYDDGDKTDLYVLFSNCMAIIQKLFFAENVYIDYLRLFDEVEVNSASLIILNKSKQFEFTDAEAFKSTVQSIFVEFTMSLSFFGELVGSFYTELDEKYYSENYLAYLCSAVETSNSQARKGMQYYNNVKRGISLLSISNTEYRDNFFCGITWETIDGIDGKILCQIDNDNSPLSFNFVSNECWSKIVDVISDMHINKFSFLCQNNALYMFEGKNIWIFDGDFSEYWVSEEKKKIIDRQNRESLILHLNRQFKWKYPVNYSRFEELMADLCETEEQVQGVRLLGKSNCPDGGRDLLIWKIQRTGETSYGNRLIIGQCKAYNRSINKSDVTDIRDTIEHHNASGFFLFASSSLTAPLIDSLLKLKEKYETEWWTEREIFSKLRQNSFIADRYTDILDISEPIVGEASIKEGMIL